VQGGGPQGIDVTLDSIGNNCPFVQLTEWTARRFDRIDLSRKFLFHSVWAKACGIAAFGYQTGVEFQSK
jgi:hypothetical protein